MSKKKKLEKGLEEEQEQLQIQSEKSDVYKKGSRVGMLTGLIFCLALVVVKLLAKQPWQDVGALYCAIFSGRYFYQWARQKKAFPMICAVLHGVASLALLISYLIVIL